ncbi:hypothetical protein GCM10007380_05260 [Gottfriedia solisilvae]|uniref:Uncharacterized protein n=1 Tax=Gottfriedia solisilvae TaxID=1516104 RepID=A0A8J3AC97_9BACI|nr:hypothetical protein GCM10007380_05260 [Gottfriedia solisilvae]
MKILICSDLHIDFNEKKLGIAFNEEFITFVKKKEPDCILGFTSYFRRKLCYFRSLK